MTGLEEVEWALTLWRPWTALVVVGPKNIENRPWAPPKWIIGKRIAIHAGLTFDDAGRATAQVILRETGFDPFDGALWQLAQVKGSIVGTAVVSDWASRDTPLRCAEEILLSPWFFGPFGWLLTDRKPLPAPVPCRGAQKLWRLPAELRRAA
ncbi:MAG: hypothetical protein ABUR63_00345 [Verrucomicrobiota bacterium]